MSDGDRPAEMNGPPPGAPGPAERTQAELEQRLVTMRLLYQQQQADLLLHFQQSYAQLAMQHAQDSQRMVHDYLHLRQQLPQRHLSVGEEMGGGLSNAVDDHGSRHSDFGSPPRAASSGGTISARTKEKLKELIYNKHRNRMSTEAGSPQYEPYPVMRQHPDTELRKAASEPNLKMKGVAALRAKLMERQGQQDRAQRALQAQHSLDTRPAAMSAGAQLAGTDRSPFFAAPSLPNIYGQLGPCLVPNSAPPGNSVAFRPSLSDAVRFFSTPSLYPCVGSWTGLGLPPNDVLPFLAAADAPGSSDPQRTADGPGHSRAPAVGGGTAPDGSFRPFDRRHATVTLPTGHCNLLREQIRDLVLRRKSLVREETDDDVKREGAQSPVEGGRTAPGRKGTGLAYDSAMCRHQCTCGDNGKHVEHGGRIQSIWARLQETGLTDECEKILTRKAPLDYLRVCHGLSYCTFFGVSPTACLKMDPAELPLKSFVQLPCGGIGVDSDTYFSDAFTPSAARAAVGCAVELTLAVAEGRLRNGFAVVRPPGHHAEASQALGFCYFNNVAIAARMAQQRAGVEKVVIVDWDVHHGNGTQLLFETDPSVLYVSLHRHDDGNFFPGTGAIEEVGKEAGEGFTVNVAWSGEAMGDAEYLAAWRCVVVPVLDQFQPDLVLVSCGFDAAEGHWNAVGGYRVSSFLFGWMTRSLLRYAKGRVVLVLEGGYDLAAISDAAEACVRALLGAAPDPADGRPSTDPDPFPDRGAPRFDARPNESARRTLERAARVQRRFWPRVCADGASVSEREWRALHRRFADLSVDSTVARPARASSGVERSPAPSAEDANDEDEELDVGVEQ